jgi:hypothetical protein
MSNQPRHDAALDHKDQETIMSTAVALPPFPSSG